jgi:hypothetical protein
VGACGEIGEESLSGDEDSRFREIGEVLLVLGDGLPCALDDIALPLPCCDRGPSLVGEVVPGSGEAVGPPDDCRMEAASCLCLEDCCCCFTALKSQSCKAKL